MCYKCGHAFLAGIIILFSFWEINASKWIIVISAGIIFLWEIYMLVAEGCGGYCKSSFVDMKTGSELIMEKSKPRESEPSRKEIVETLKKKQ